MSRPRAALWLGALGSLFYLGYGFANWLAAQRADVPSVVFAWEGAIPFLPWTIIPYWSINLLYAVALFLCTSGRELDTLGRRLLTAQIIAVACFILFPLRATFTRPETEGLPGLLFAALDAFDQPFNQAPSLHIAILTILWPHYLRHLPRWARGLCHGWATLIALSTLTTNQHHFVDLPTGLLLGLVGLWLWPERATSPVRAFAPTRDPARLRLAATYGACAVVIFTMAILSGGWAFWLAWPALSLALVALNYAALGPAGFQKDFAGRVSFASRALFEPYRMAAWVNARAWTRHDHGPDWIADNVWIGRRPTRHELGAGRFVAVIDLAAEFPAVRSTCRWRSLPMLDLVAPDPARLHAAVAAVESASRSGPVLIACALGYSRSATVAAHWLLATGRASDLDAAIARVRAARPSVVFHRSLPSATTATVRT